MVWAGDVQGELGIDGEGGDEVDRLFTFEVMKTNEQEENVVSRPGIAVRTILSMPTNAECYIGQSINAVSRAWCCRGALNSAHAVIPLWRENAGRPYFNIDPPKKERREI